eukprot:gnl/TRDRNA2_/TRDRNA2_160735_c0_seq1.p1 gnl/TRDRNA2_/TRDRNA2_160735_c0~~gnl/TRDRNA2_/TRDRNA2_160735_c0_seq1.p1  ORF type:complete len:268 (+),score=48.61 gnl/TRDRNA2_/TRDRNA2_160735_c0_seq1:89-892(+)
MIAFGSVGDLSAPFRDDRIETATYLSGTKGQTPQQCAALFCATAAGALLVVAPGRSSKTMPAPKAKADTDLVPGSEQANGTAVSASIPQSSGIVFALMTAMFSGIAAALSQAAMQRSTRLNERPSALFTLELAVWGVPFTLMTAVAEMAKDHGALVRGWECRTVVPVALQAAGGVLVGALIKVRGGVAMGLCTVLGIGVSAIATSIQSRQLPACKQVLAGLLAALSIFVHQHGFGSTFEQASDALLGSSSISVGEEAILKGLKLRER